MEGDTEAQKCILVLRGNTNTKHTRGRGTCSLETTGGGVDEQQWAERAGSVGAGLSRQHRRGRWHRTPAAHHAPRRAAAAHTFRRGYAPLGCAGAAPPNICTTAPDCPRSHACWREVIALASMQTTASASRTVPTGPCGTHAEHGGTRAPAAAAREPARRRHSTAAPVRELLRRRA